MENEEVLFLEPQLKDVIWGGNKLRDEFHYTGAGDSTGECWGISAHPNGDCRILNGSFSGMTLSALYKEHRELFGDITPDEFPLLVKIIDTKENLSIQVHPDDTYAKVHENYPYGKTECWYIMDCPQDAKLVMGHYAKSRGELAKMIEEDRYDDLIRQVPVHKGDFIQINPGTVHAIGSGFTILETQQSSDITYRVYDYKRLVDGKERPLHVRQSIDVIQVPDTTGEEGIKSTEALPLNQMNLLISCDYYKVWKLNVNRQVKVEQKQPFLLASVLEGKGMVNGTPVTKGNHFILPAGMGEIVFDGSMELILSSI